MISNLLIPKEKIVGIEINSQKLRMLFLELDKNNEAKVKGKSELELEEEIFSFQGVVDEKKLSKAINKLKNNFKPKKNLSQFAIVTIPSNGVYSEILEFPKTLDSEQLSQAIAINAAENLPLTFSESYLDWQIVENSGNKNKVLISIVSKKIADNYINALKENGFELIALETSFLSIQRAVHIPQKPTIFLYLTDEGITSIIYKDKYPYFNQFESYKEIVPEKEIKNLKDLNKAIKNKIKKLKLYFQSQTNNEIEEVLLMGYGFDADVIINKIGETVPKIKKAELKIKSIDNSDWIPVAGAAARAFIPRNEDTIISLLPLGTESLYETQKDISFIKSILLLFSTLAIFYIIIFISTYLFISSLKENIDKQINKRSNFPVSEEYIKMKTDTQEFNSYLNDLEKIYPKIKSNYNEILKNINALNTPGIKITKINLEKETNLIYISAIATDRNNINILRSKIENSKFFTTSEFFIKNIAQKENIDFEINLYIN